MLCQQLKACGVRKVKYLDLIVLKVLPRSSVKHIGTLFVALTLSRSSGPNGIFKTSRQLCLRRPIRGGKIACSVDERHVWVYAVKVDVVSGPVSWQAQGTQTTCSQMVYEILLRHSLK